MKRIDPRIEMKTGIEVIDEKKMIIL